MCISREHLVYLADRNEEDYAVGRIGYETHIRFDDQASRCERCELLGNARQGDMMEDCRLRILRFFIAGRRDDEKRLADRESTG